MRLGGKAVIVTGGGSGIGRGVALRFAQEGARLVIADVNVSAAEETVAMIKDISGDANAAQTDVSRKAEVDSMVSRSVECFGQIDILVNNAGVSGEVPFLDMDEAEWDRVLAVNLKGAFLCGQAVARAMVQAGTGGKIVNIASVNAEVAGTGLAHYCSSKGGLRMLTKVMALELAPYKINVNAVAPGIIETPLTASSLADPGRRQSLMAHVPWGRVGRPEDVADAVLFLASDQADFVTGTTLFVDGGWLIE
jgi:NAD(P)-dependent dehydrogenase (short-subunit alcohol dehydrogenase family)